MLPIPVEKYIPTFYERDDELIAFANKLEELITEWGDETLDMNNFKDPVRVPAIFISELGNLLSAGIRNTDSTREKRQKVVGAVASHKKRSTWLFDAKPKVDIICGGDSEIIRSFDKDDWILVGDGLTPSAYYWAAMGADGIDDDLGISLIGSGLEIEVAGNIYIDVDNASLSAEDQAALQLEMEDITPAYMYTHFGYISGGAFVEYFVLGI